jgi:SAM-dependent methyltransferase
MAHHKVFSKQRWGSAQKAELHLFGIEQSKHADITNLTNQAIERYGSLLKKYTPDLNDDAEILEIGCGPACVSQVIPHGHKTYLDPLLDDFRRTWPGSLPKGRFITGMAEHINMPDQSYDVIVCLKTISHVQNPELVLHEMERLLKPNGILVFSATVWPLPFAQLHYFTANLFPQRVLTNRLYCYTQRGIENSLKRHFCIDRAETLPPQSMFTLKQERLYICSPLNAS